MKRRLLRAYSIGLLTVTPFLPFAYIGVRSFGDVLTDTANVIGLPISAPVAALYGRGGGVPALAPFAVAFVEINVVAFLSFLILSARAKSK